MSHDNKQNNKITGKEGEELAIAYLQKKGMVLRDQNFVSGKYEIDLIFQDGPILVFVEVKMRIQARVEPEHAVNYVKQRHIASAAENYLRVKRIYPEIRFDIISINRIEGKTEIIHFKDAFYPLKFLGR